MANIAARDGGPDPIQVGMKADVAPAQGDAELYDRLAKRVEMSGEFAEGGPLGSSKPAAKRKAILDLLRATHVETGRLKTGMQYDLPQLREIRAALSTALNAKSVDGEIIWPGGMKPWQLIRTASVHVAEEDGDADDSHSSAAAVPLSNQDVRNAPPHAGQQRREFNGGPSPRGPPGARPRGDADRHDRYDRSGGYGYGVSQQGGGGGVGGGGWTAPVSDELTGLEGSLDELLGDAGEVAAPAAESFFSFAPGVGTGHTLDEIESGRMRAREAAAARAAALKVKRQTEEAEERDRIAAEREAELLELAELEPGIATGKPGSGEAGGGASSRTLAHMTPSVSALFAGPSKAGLDGETEKDREKDKAEAPRTSEVGANDVALSAMLSKMSLGSGSGNGSGGFTGGMINRAFGGGGGMGGFGTGIGVIGAGMLPAGASLAPGNGPPPGLPQAPTPTHAANRALQAAQPTASSSATAFSEDAIMLQIRIQEKMQAKKAEALAASGAPPAPAPAPMPAPGTHVNVSSLFGPSPTQVLQKQVFEAQQLAQQAAQAQILIQEAQQQAQAQQRQAQQAWMHQQAQAQYSAAQQQLLAQVAQQQAAEAAVAAASAVCHDVYVTGLLPSVQPAQLYGIMKGAGRVIGIRLHYGDNGAPRGSGFVHFQSREAATAAVATLHGRVIYGLSTVPLQLSVQADPEKAVQSAMPVPVGAGLGVAPPEGAAGVAAMLQAAAVSRLQGQGGAPGGHLGGGVGAYPHTQGQLAYLYPGQEYGGGHGPGYMGYGQGGMPRGYSLPPGTVVGMPPTAWGGHGQGMTQGGAGPRQGGGQGQGPRPAGR